MMKFLSLFNISQVVVIIMICINQFSAVEAGDPKGISYGGQLDSKSSVVIELTYPLVMQKHGLKVSFAGNRMCECDGTYEGEIDGQKVFSLMSQNGGVFCDNCNKISIRQSGKKDSLFYTLSKSDTIFKGTLTKLKNTK
jgi:hypothetical protein